MKPTLFLDRLSNSKPDSESVKHKTIMANFVNKIKVHLGLAPFSCVTDLAKIKDPYHLIESLKNVFSSIAEHKDLPEAARENLKFADMLASLVAVRKVKISEALHNNSYELEYKVVFHDPLQPKLYNVDVRTDRFYITSTISSELGYNWDDLFKNEANNKASKYAMADDKVSKLRQNVIDKLVLQH